MKELTIEQKAKAYDEALKVLHKYDGANIMFTQDLKEEMFPELKESEDERIRKRIYDYINVTLDDNESTEKEKWLAWLEKQGEQKPVWSEYDERILKTIIIGIENEMFSDVMREEYQRIPNTNKNYYQIRIDWLKSIEQRLKGWDGERKQLITLDHFEDKGDMVEPKFKVGDWIACENLNTALIVNIVDDKYEVEFIDGNKGFPHIDYIDRLFHLWSIEDAKDGDVLVSLSKMHPFIFNGHYDEDTDFVYAYCGISDIIKNDSFYFDKYPDEEFKVWDSVENVRPATRDQRNLLFSKMKDSGYEWDSKKKELIKTEQV